MKILFWIIMVNSILIIALFILFFMQANLQVTALKSQEAFDQAQVQFDKNITNKLSPQSKYDNSPTISL